MKLLRVLVINLTCGILNCWVRSSIIKNVIDQRILILQGIVKLRICFQVLKPNHPMGTPAIAECSEPGSSSESCHEEWTSECCKGCLSRSDFFTCSFTWSIPSWPVTWWMFSHQELYFESWTLLSFRSSTWNTIKVSVIHPTHIPTGHACGRRSLSYRSLSFPFKTLSALLCFIVVISRTKTAIEYPSINLVLYPYTPNEELDSWQIVLAHLTSFLEP